jgi:hypothetical protein
MDTTIAFVRSKNGGDTEVVVNFGLLCGREATLAEVDRLAGHLCSVLPEVRVHAVRTHDMARGSEAVVHQVVVEAGPAGVDVDAEELRTISEAWARDCAADRSLEPLGL